MSPAQEKSINRRQIYDIYVSGKFAVVLVKTK